MNARFETRDHELASTLVTLGYEVGELVWEGEDSNRPFAIFAFDGEEEKIGKEADDFFLGKEKNISPRDLFANHKKLRTWIYEEKDRLERGKR